MARHRADYVGERRTDHFRCQLTPSEKRNLETGAELLGVNLSDYGRRYLPLGKVPRRQPHHRQRDKIRAQLFGELGRIGNNLNQLARHANETGNMPALAALESCLQEIKSATSRIV
jgi:Bacterial mobilisation protein (MobC)